MCSFFRGFRRPCNTRLTITICNKITDLVEIILTVCSFSEGFGGPVKQEYISGPEGKRIGLRFIITRVTQYDKGAYECKVENNFGTDRKYLHVNVALDFNNG